MKMKYKKVMIILLILILIMTAILFILVVKRAGFNKIVDNLIFGESKVIKILQKNENEVVKYVQKELNKKYPEITTIKLLNKHPLIHSFPAMGIGGERAIEGAYEYKFSIEDKYNNRSMAIYKDAYKFRHERYNNRLIEYYHNIKDNYDKLETYAKFIEPYSESFKVLKKYYSAEKYSTEVRIVYVLDLKYYDLDNSTYKDFASFFQFLENYAAENEVSDIYHIDFSFKDKVVDYYTIRKDLGALKASNSI